MLVSPDLAQVSPLRKAIRDLHRADEAAVVTRLLDEAQLPHDAQDRIAAQARRLVEAVRLERLGQGGLTPFFTSSSCRARKASSSCAWQRRYCACPMPRRWTN